MLKHFLNLALTLLFFYARVAAQPGALDVSFGQGGKVISEINNINNIASTILAQPDGKLIVIGSSIPGGYQGYFSIARYNYNGSLDQTFGVNGLVETHLNYDEAHAQAGLLQPDGKIVVAGYAWSGANYDFAIIRYTSDGKRDLTFGMGGVVLTDFDGRDDKVNSLALHSNGNIIAGGSIEEINFFEMDAAFACYDQNGSLVNNFGSDGKVICNISESGLWQSIHSLVIQSDGKILAGGYTEHHELMSDDYTEAFLLLRLLSNGTLDPNFGDAGIIKTLIGEHSIGKSVAVDGSGRILMLGKASLTSGGPDAMALVRYDSDGTLDENFGNQGIVITTFDNVDDVGNCLLIQPDQKILAAGVTATTSGTTLNFALARYHTNGTMDISFGSGGKITTDFNNDWDFGTSVALQKNGKIVVAGYSKSSNDYDFALARYLNDDALPVKLESFFTEKEGESVRLYWQTSVENNSDYFEIQRSSNGKDWLHIGSKAAAINSNSLVTYEFFDNLPLKSNFYRLKMIDADGTYAFSSIKSIRCETDMVAQELSIFPNPADSKITVRVKNISKIMGINIVDSNGRITPVQRNSRNELDMQNFRPGIYHVVVLYINGNSESRKILIQ